MRFLSNWILATMLLFSGCEAYADAVIFSGSDVKALKPNLDLFGAAKIMSGTVDPSSSATSANRGSLYLNTSTGYLFRKLDNGSSTNWERLQIELSGTDAKILSSVVDINGNSKILSGSADPSSSATSAPIGSIYLNTVSGDLYKKLDAGSTTNWVKLGQDTGSGVKNYVKNPSMTPSTLSDITDASTIATRNTTTPLTAPADISIDATSSGQKVIWDTFTKDNILKNGNCEASFYYSGDASLYKAYVQINSVTVSAEITLQNSGSGTFNSGPITYPCGDLTNVSKVVIEATSASAAAIKVDEVYDGKPTSLYQVPAQSEEINGGEITIGATTTAPTKATTRETDRVTYVRDGKFAIITYRYYHSSNAGAATGSGSYLLSLPNNLVADTTYVPVLGTTLDSSNRASIEPRSKVGVGRIHDGSNRGYMGCYLYSTTQITCGHDVVFSSNGPWGSAGYSYAATTTYGFEITIRVPIQGWAASQTAAAAQQTDYGWTSWTPTFTGFGTVTNIECQHRRTKENMDMRCKFTAGTTTATEARVSLPNSLTSSSTTKIPSIQISGQYVRANASTDKGGVVLIEPSTAYVTFSSGAVFGSSSSAALTKANGNTVSAGTEVINFQASIPINGWEENQRAPTLIGSVTSNSVSALHIESAFISYSAGVPSASGNYSSWISSLTDNATGDATLNLASGTFSATPQCFVTSVDSNTNNQSQITSNSSSAIRILVSAGGTAADRNYNVMCMGPR